MKYVTCSLRNETVRHLGVVRENRLLVLRNPAASEWPGPFPLSLLELIEAGPEVWGRMKALAESLPVSADTSHPLERVRLHAPIPQPAKNIVCL